jgi:hypothetical protein
MIAVTVVVDGRTIATAVPAKLVAGVVRAPFEPFAAALAGRMRVDPARMTVTLERDDRSVTMALPPGGAGSATFPLAAAARGLGDSVRYEASSRTLSIWEPQPGPVATLTPFGGFTPPPGPLPTFTPTVFPTPGPVLTGIPQPRRTPIVVFGRPAP